MQPQNVIFFNAVAVQGITLLLIMIAAFSCLEDDDDASISYYLIVDVDSQDPT
jgi:hypothetical protein